MSDYLRQLYSRLFAWARGHLKERLIPVVLFIALGLSFVYAVTFSAPFNFPSDSMVKVKQGSSIADVAVLFKERGIVRSVFWFEVATRLAGRNVIAGEYYFERPSSVFSIASRLARGDYDLEPIKVTIPEGANVFEITKLLSQSLADFDDKKFLELAESKEGYLFPDTYFFYPGAEPELVIQTMENNFTLNMAKISTTTVLSGISLNDILTMASLLEEEAPNTEDRQIIAGILWRRIEIGMPLQVDAVFPYIIGKNSFNLTRADLQTDSPYNTYKYKGLPPGPITNPGLDSIYAAVTPRKSTYLYYLSDLEGNFHYCSTYTCHVANKAKYLGT